MRFNGAVMVGIGGGTPDRVLLGWAADEAAARAAHLVVCHIRERGEPDRSHDAAESPGSAEFLVREAAGIARSWFPDLEVSTAVGDGQLVPALLRASKDARMLVVGARGTGGFAGLRLGSVADQVAAHAQCPVAVVHQPSSPDSVDVVVGVDGSSHSDTTLRLAAAEARRFGGRLLVVHAYRLPPPAEYGPNAGVDEPHHRANAEELLERALTRLGPAQAELKIETRAVHAGSAAALLEASSAAAVIVVGARGSGGFTGLALGSVSQQVLRHASCAVIVAR
ncbi:MAG TPA: universal stress protein [Mycobacteriales bacterium]